MLSAYPGAAQQPPQLPTVEFTVEVLGTTMSEFVAKMDAYAALRGSLQKGLPQLRVTDRPAEIREAERALAESEALDPESAGETFEPMARPGLLARLRA